MKKSVNLLLVGVMTFSLVACNSDKNNSGPTSVEGFDYTWNGEEIGDEVYVSVLDAGMGKEWIEMLAAAYYEETGILVNVSADPDLVSSVQTKLPSNAEKDDLYFVNGAESNWLKWTTQGLIESLDDVMVSEKYGTAAKDRAMDSTVLEVGKYSDSIYLAPYLYSNWGIIYNQKYLDQIDSFGLYETGIMPDTVQGLIDLCTAVKAADMTNSRTGRKVAPFSCGLNVNYMNYFFLSLWYEQDAEGYNAYWAQNDKSAFQAQELQSEAVKNALAAINDLMNATSETDSNLVSYNQNHLESQQSFVNGDCVFTFCGSWFETEMKEVMQQVGMTTYHYTAYPTLKEGNKPSLNINLPGEYFFIPEDAYNKAGAKDFLAFCLSEQGVAIAEEQLSHPMAYKTAEDREVTVSQFGKEIREAINKSNTFYKYNNTPVYRTGALSLWLQTTSPFITMAKGKVDSSKVLEQCVNPEIIQHNSLWEDYMKNIG